MAVGTRAEGRDTNRRQAASPDSDPFRLLVEHAQDAICEVDTQLRILYVNPRFSELSGFDASEIVGTDALARVHPEDCAEAERARGQVLASGIVTELMFRYQTKAGSWLWVELAARGFQTPEGEPRAVLVTRDVTARVASARALAEQLEAEQRLAALSRRFLTLRPEDMGEGISLGLKAAAELAGADRIQLVVGNPDSKRSPKLFQWCREGVEPRSAEGWQEWTQSFPWATRLLAGGELVKVPRIADMPAEAEAERLGLEAQRAHSYLAIPISDGERRIGFFDFTWIRRAGHWSAQDITRLQLLGEVLASLAKRQRAEAARRESEERLRSLAENVSDTLCEIDDEGKLIFASPNVEMLTGYAFDEIRARGLDALLQAEAAGSTAGDGPVFAGGGSYRIRHRDGSLRWIESSARRFESADGRPRVALVLRDITDTYRRRAELERQLVIEKQIAEFSREFLERAAADVEAAIQHGLEAAAGLAGADRCFLMALMDQQGERPRLFEWQDEGLDRPAPAIEFKDVSRRQYVTRRLLEGEPVHAANLDQLPEEASHMRRIYAEAGVKSFLMIPIHDADKWVGVLGFHCYRNERRWQQGEIALLRLIAGLFTSLLRRKRAEEELKDSQTQLVQAQKMEAVGTLAGGIAHDFNNQLAVMLGNARYLLRDMTEEGNAKEALVDLERAAQHCAQLTRSLLAFSRRGTVSPQPVDVGQAVTRAAALLEPLMPSTIDLSVDLGVGVGAVIADPTQLEQVLVNLAVNARDAMPSGGRLRIETRWRQLDETSARRLNLAEGGEYAEIAMRDEGLGMDEATRARVFEPFFTTKEVGKGTGLGLATAYGIIEDCEGSISVESRPEEGAIFRVLLPCIRNRRATPSRESGARPGESVVGSGVVLLVEDEGGVRRFLSRTLKAAGYRVIEAEDGVSAIAALDDWSDPIDFLVTDLEMPRMGGIELAEAVVDRFAGTRVLFLSGYSSDRLVGTRPPIPGARFLQKPFTDDAVLHELRALVDPADGSPRRAST